MKVLLLKYLILVISAAFLFTSCEFSSDAIDENDNNGGFESSAVSLIISQNCATFGCHAGANPKNGLSLENHSSLIKGSNSRPLPGGGTYGGDVVVPFRPEKSLLYQMISGGTSVQMPYGRSALSTSDINLVKEWIENGALDYSGAVPFENPSSYRVYVCNQGADQLSLIDASGGVVSRVVDLDRTPNFNDKPHMVKEYGDYYYVTLIGTGQLLKLNKSDNSIAGSVSNLGVPGMIQLTSDGRKAYVSRSSTAQSIYSSIYVIDTENMTLQKELELSVVGVPHGISLSSDDSKLYVANFTRGYIHTIDAALDQETSFTYLGEETRPMQAALSPDDSFLYISASGTNQILVIETMTMQQTAAIQTGMMPMHIAVSSDGNRIYVPAMGENSVQVIEKNFDTWGIVSTITHRGLSMPHGADLSSDDKYLFVSSRNTSGSFVPAYSVNGEGKPGTVCIINTETLTVEKLLEVEEFASGLTVEKL